MTAGFAGLGDTLLHPNNPGHAVLKTVPRFMVCDASQALLAFSFDISFGNVTSGEIAYTIQQEGTFTFNRAGKVTAPDMQLIPKCEHPSSLASPCQRSCKTACSPLRPCPTLDCTNTRMTPPACNVVPGVCI